MTREEIIKIVTTKNIRIENRNYKETLNVIDTLTEEFSLAPYFKEINKDNIDYLRDYTVITVSK